MAASTLPPASISSRDDEEGRTGDSSLPDVPGVHAPRQARSRETFARILGAARGLMEEGGVEEVTVQEVVRRAGIGVGSFYARFEGREALIRYLHEELWSDAGRWWTTFLEPSRWSGAPLPAVAGEVVRVLVRTHFARELELRAFWIRALARPADRIMERTAEWDATFVEGFARLLEERREAVAHPRPGRAARMGAFQVLTTLRGHLFFPDSLFLDGGFSLRELTLELTRGLLGYLDAPGAPETYGELLAASPRLGFGA